MRLFDLSELDDATAYRLLLGAVVPRPIAWVSTLDDEGRTNLAPFSFFTVASRNPPVLAISIGTSQRAGAPEKDTLRNVRARRELVVNVVPESLISEMVVSSHGFEPGVSEFDAAGIELVPSTTVAPPGVARSPVRMECTLFDVHPIGTDTLVLARVRLVTASEHVADEEGHIDLVRLAPVGKVAGPHYVCDLHDVELTEREASERLQIGSRRDES